MSRSFFAGDTDYSRQSFDEIVKDLKAWVKDINDTKKFFNENIESLKKTGYLDSNVPDDYKILLSKTIEILETSLTELTEISCELLDEVRIDHVKRLDALGVVAQKLSKNYGIIWHQKYPNKEYLDENFNIIEDLYSNGRDELNNMMDLSNIAIRLRDFVGKKSKSKWDFIELNPNFYGIGFNIKNILKRFKKN